MRQGAYATGRRALEEAVRIFPDYALAHSRLAEAHAELDEERDAQASLIRVGALVPDQSRLAVEDRLRLDAIRATVLRDFDRAIAAYTDLSLRRPRDAGALVDLGRAQESAGRLVEARETYERATALDPQFAAGFLRLGAINGSMGAIDQSVRAFDEAERLYTLESNAEGQVETMLRRGAMLDAAGRFDEALALAERAGRVATESGLVAQELRAGFLRGSTLVGAGRFADGEAAARANVDKALAAGLQGVAADGLIDMAGALLVSGRLDEADQALVRARAIADERSLMRTAMRAATQQASLKLQEDQPKDALALLGPPLKYFADTRHQRLEAVALTIGSRAHEALGQFAEARAMAQRVFDFAAASGNRAIQAQVAHQPGQPRRCRRQPAPRPRPISPPRSSCCADSAIARRCPFALTSLRRVADSPRPSRRGGAVLAELDAGIAAKAGAFPTRVRRCRRSCVACCPGRSPLCRGPPVRRSPSSTRRPDAPTRPDWSPGRRLAVAEAHLGMQRPVPGIETGCGPGIDDGDGDPGLARAKVSSPAAPPSRRVPRRPRS